MSGAQRDSSKSLRQAIGGKAEHRKARRLRRIVVTIDVGDVSALIQVIVDSRRSIRQRLDERKVRFPVPPTLGHPQARGNGDEDDRRNPWPRCPPPSDGADHLSHYALHLTRVLGSRPSDLLRQARASRPHRRGEQLLHPSRVVLECRRACGLLAPSPPRSDPRVKTISSSRGRPAFQPAWTVPRVSAIALCVAPIDVSLSSAFPVCPTSAAGIASRSIQPLMDRERDGWDGPLGRSIRGPDCGGHGRRNRLGTMQRRCARGCA